MRELSLAEMLRELRAVDNLGWGRYAFSRDFLRDRVPPGRRDELITGAVTCGEQWADRMFRQTGTSDPMEMAAALNLRVREGGQPMTDARALFAQFVPDDLIEIMSHPLNTYRGLYDKNDSRDVQLFPTPEQVRDLLLAHEIFHFVEDVHEGEIYTRTQTIRLWKFFGFRNDSTIRAVGEIAAMSFARTLTGVEFSPFLLDILLFFGYNPTGARSLYADVMAAAHGS